MKFSADPISLLWFGIIIVGIVCLARKRKRTGWMLLGLALAASLIEMCNVPARLLASLEKPYLKAGSVPSPLAERDQPSYLSGPSQRPVPLASQTADGRRQRSDVRGQTSVPSPLAPPATSPAERPSPLAPPATSPAERPPAQRAEAVVVLGGYGQAFDKDPLGLELNFSGDRLLKGIALMRADKGKVLVLSGGSCRGGAAGGREQGAGSRDQTSDVRSQTSGPSPPAVRPLAAREEAEAAAAWIRDWKLVEQPVQALPPSRNTHDEALKVAELANRNGWKRIILVTSAWHMRRAAATFRKAGLNVEPVGADFEGSAALEGDRHFTFIPRTRSVDLLRLWLEENVGYAVYWVRGWA